MAEFSIVSAIFLLSFAIGKVMQQIVKKVATQTTNFRYFAIEIVTLVVTFLLYLKLTISFEFFIMIAIFYILILLSFIDIRLKAVPDYMLLLVLLLPFFLPTLDKIEQFKSAFMLTGAVVVLSFFINFYVQNIKSKLFKDESLKGQTVLGEGDLPIIALIGATLGIQSSLYAIFLASFFAIIPALYNRFVKKELETPFIPFLALGFFVEYNFEISKAFS